VNLSYFFRLFCLAFACFAVIHLLLGALVTCCESALCRRAHQLSPSVAANVCFAARVLPACAALAVVLAVCVPSYLQWEPLSAAEPLGLTCLSGAALGVFLWSYSLFRTTSAVVASVRFNHGWGKEPHSGPQIALAGIVTPRIVVSEAARRALTAEQLGVVLRHERAHYSNRDNLKRFLLLLIPSCLPFSNGFRRVEQSWAKFSEWAADDSAAVTCEDSLTLAGALVCIARLQIHGPVQPVLWTSFLADEQDLPVRVERLLLRASKPVPAKSTFAHPVIASAIALSAFLLSKATQAGFLHAVHRSLEIFIH